MATWALVLTDIVMMWTGMVSAPGAWIVKIWFVQFHGGQITAILSFDAAHSIGMKNQGQKQKPRRNEPAGLEKSKLDQRLLYWKRFRAPGWPYFLRSFMRGSRVSNPSAFKAGRSVASTLSSARAMPWRTA